jgi:DNA polymerase III subunit beta
MATAKKRAPVADLRRSAFRIRAGSLKAALGDIAQVVAAKNTIPICSMVLVQAGDGLLTLAATNLDIWATRDLATDDREPNSDLWRGSIRAFAVCVPAKPLLAILGEVDADAMVTVEAMDEASATNGGPVKVTAGRSRWTLKGLPSADWPGAVPADWECEFGIKATALADAFAAVDHAISTEETRYYLNGVYFHPDSEPGGALDLRMAATDGHRLARLAFDAPEGALGAPNVIVPRQVVSVLVKELARVADEAHVGVSFGLAGKLMLFTLPMPDDGTLLIQAKTVDGTFPDYTRVIPSVSTKRLTVEREALLGALRRVAVLAEGKTRAIKLDAEDDRLTLTATSPELGDACEEVPCVYGGEPITWGFDGRYFRDALQAVASDEVRLMLTDSGGPVRIEGVTGADEAPLVQVVMPIRV